jgi:hypothetical protein
MRFPYQLATVIPALAAGLSVGYAADLLGAPSPVPGTAAVAATLPALFSLDLLAGAMWPNWQVTVGHWPARAVGAVRRLIRPMQRSR